MIKIQIRCLGKHPWLLLESIEAMDCSECEPYLYIQPAYCGWCSLHYSGVVRTGSITTYEPIRYNLQKFDAEMSYFQAAY